MQVMGWTSDSKWWGQYTSLSVTLLFSSPYQPPPPPPPPTLPWTLNDKRYFLPRLMNFNYWPLKFRKLKFPARIQCHLPPNPPPPPIPPLSVSVSLTGVSSKVRFNRPLHGFRRHLGCGAVAAKITANVWEILQLSTLITPQLHVQF